MRILKKILAVTFLLLLFVQTGLSVSAFTDTKGTAYQDKAEFLCTLEIMETESGENFGVDTEVTRGDFAIMVAKALKLEVGNDSYQSQVYIDVPPTHKAFSSVHALLRAGIMLGHANASFQPDAILKFEDGVKTFVAANGYTKVAEARGGYPTGYLVVGNERRISSGMQLGSGAHMKKGDVALLIYNGILANKLDIATISGDDVTLAEQNGQTILSTAYHIYKSTGVVNGYGETTLKNPEDSITEGRVLIDDVLYYTGKTNPEKYFATRIEYFYQYDEEQDTSTLVYISSKETLNDIITVNAQNIDVSTSLTKLVYKENDKNGISKTIPSNARFIYNGKILPLAVSEDLKPLIGDVTLIDSNLDKKYETVVIRDFKNVVVDSVIPLDGIVRVKFTNETLTLDAEAANTTVRFIKDGFEVEISSVAQWNILSVLESKNITGNRLFTVYISEAKATGIVTETSEDNNGDFMIVLDNGDSYILSKSYQERAEAKLNGCAYPEAGDECTFYLDIFGNIDAKYADVASQNNYGFFISADVGQGVDKTIKLKIFTMNDAVEIFETSSKVTVNGVKQTEENILNALRLNPADASSAVNPQLIIYNVNASGFLDEYRTADDKTDETDYYAADDDFVLSVKSDSTFRVYKNIIQNNALVVSTNNTIVFDIPADLTREREYSIGRKFAIDESVAAPLYVYNLKSGGVMGVFVIRSGGAGSSKYADPQVVEKVANAVDEDGNEKLKIYFSGGASIWCEPDNISYEAKTYSAYKNVKITDLKEGDIIQYTLKNNEINKLFVLVRANNLGEFRSTRYANDATSLDENLNQFTKVISISEDRKFMVVEYAGNKESRQIAGSVRRYNSKTGRMEASAAADIQPGDTIFLNAFWLSTRMIVIYR